MPKQKSSLPRRVRSTNPVTILKAVIRAIEEEPRRYNQSLVVERREEEDDGYCPRARDYWPSCGTVACVAGWTNLLTGASKDEQESLSRAEDVLGLTYDEGEQLFHESAAGPIRSTYPGDRGPTPRAHARAGIRHIKRFVKAKWGVNL